MIPRVDSDVVGSAFKREIEKCQGAVFGACMSRVGDCREDDKKYSASPEEAKYTSESEEASKRSRRKESKKLAKENKAPKSKKQKRDHGDRSSESVVQSEPVVDNSEIQSIEPNEPIVTVVSKVDFFANLAAAENQKPAVGTIHTAGKKDKEVKKDSNWTCQKCSTSNQNNAHQCTKCRAIKRLTLYR